MFRPSCAFASICFTNYSVLFLTHHLLDIQKHEASELICTGGFANRSDKFMDFGGFFCHWTTARQVPTDFAAAGLCFQRLLPEPPREPVLLDVSADAADAAASVLPEPHGGRWAVRGCSRCAFSFLVPKGVPNGCTARWFEAYWTPKISQVPVFQSNYFRWAGIRLQLSRSRELDCLFTLATGDSAPEQQGASQQQGPSLEVHPNQCDLPENSQSFVVDTVD